MQFLVSPRKLEGKKTKQSLRLSPPYLQRANGYDHLNQHNQPDSIDPRDVWRWWQLMLRYKPITENLCWKSLISVSFFRNFQQHPMKFHGNFSNFWYQRSDKKTQKSLKSPSIFTLPSAKGCHSINSLGLRPFDSFVPGGNGVSSLGCHF